MTHKFSHDEIVFAKLKGWPAWPAKVEYFQNIGNTDKVKYNVYFFGTNQTAQCKEDQLFSYIRYRNRFGKPKKAADFMKAIAQADEEVRRHRPGQNKAKVNKPINFNLDYLKDELEVLKIDKAIINSLDLNEPQLDTCLKFLEEYSEVNITPLMFKKTPHLIDTLLKLQVYSIENRHVDENNLFEDEKKIHMIRSRARTVYLKVQSLFTKSQENTFLELLEKNLDEFQKHIENMSEDQIIQLSRDPTGGY